MRVGSTRLPESVCRNARSTGRRRARFRAGLGTYICDAYPEYSRLAVEEISDPRLVLVSALIWTPNACKRGSELGSLISPTCRKCQSGLTPNVRSAAQSVDDSVSRQSVVPRKYIPLLIRNNPVGSALQGLIRCYELWREMRWNERKRGWKT